MHALFQGGKLSKLGQTTFFGCQQFRLDDEQSPPHPADIKTSALRLQLSQNVQGTGGGEEDGTPPPETLH